MIVLTALEVVFWLTTAVDGAAARSEPALAANATAAAPRISEFRTGGDRRDATLVTAEGSRAHFNCDLLLLLVPRWVGATAMGP